MDLAALNEKWSDQEESFITFPAGALTHPLLTENTRTFLTTYGLSESVAPSLNFAAGPNSLLTVNQYYRIDWEGLDDYLVIGHNGSGDPLCIDLRRDNEIVYLNHDYSFERVWINTTVVQLSRSLLTYKLFNTSLLNLTDPNDFSMRKFSDAEFSLLQADFQHIDLRALDAGTFWQMELDALVWERDH